MSAQTDKDVAERVMGWTLVANRWFDGLTDTGWRTNGPQTFNPSDDSTKARVALKKWVSLNRTARTIEPDGGQVTATLFEENLQTVDGVLVNVGLEVKHAGAATLPAAICGALLS